MEIEITDSFVRICVEDEGEGFDPEKIPDPTLDENLLKECGRGVYLLTHLMDSVEYKKNGRCVIMTKNFRSENKQGRG